MLNKKKEEPHKQIDKAALLHSPGDDEWTAIVERVELTPPLFNSLSQAATFITRKEKNSQCKARQTANRTPEKRSTIKNGGQI